MTIPQQVNSILERLPANEQVFFLELVKRWSVNSGEIVRKKDMASTSKTMTQEERVLRLKWLEELNASIELSLDEELPDIVRSPMREPIILSD